MGKNRYNVIIKVSDKVTNNKEYLKYRGVFDFRSLIGYLDNKGKKFIYLNYYDMDTKLQKGSYTNKNPP